MRPHAGSDWRIIDPTRIDAVIFGLEGVLTDTARLDSRSWQRLLNSRGITLPAGAETDPPTAETVWGLANRKNLYFSAALHDYGVEVFPSSVALVRSLRGGGVRTAVVSGSRNADEILALAGIDGLFEVVVDGVEADRMGLARPPAPDQFAEATRRLGLPVDRVAVVDDAVSAVRSARTAAFARVIGVARSGQATALREAGADVVVGDLADIRVERADTCCPAGPGGVAAWVLTFDGYDPADEGRRETLCATGNGYMTTRAAAPETPTGAGYPGTYLAGVYNRLASQVGAKTVEHEELVNLPNWLATTFRAEDGAWFGAGGWERLDHRQQIDVRHGILTKELRLRDQDGRVTTVTQRQFTSMSDPHLAVLQLTFTPENWSGSLQVQTGIDGGVTNSGVLEYRLLASRHLETERAMPIDDETDLLVTRTVQSGVRVALATRVRLSGAGAAGATSHAEPTGDRVERLITVDVCAREQTTLEKTVAVFTSRDAAIAECGHAAATAVGRAADFAGLAKDHRMAWEALWSRAGLWLDVEGRASLIANLHVLHLLQSVSPHTADLDAGVTARGLHGEAYRGHVFWDELFFFPFVNFRFPELARALLLYRYRRLAEARRLAAEAGHSGAMFPWQSGTDGREETPQMLYNVRSGRWMPDNSRRQRHVSLAVGYNVWAYYQVTGDVSFMAHYGAEMLIEIARLFTSLATYDAGRDRYDICGVMGPDEFHDGPPAAPGTGLVNNAYTNVMTAWLLWRAREAFDLVTSRFGGDLAARLDVGPEELSRWEDVSRKLTVPFDRAGRLAQFDGYEDLEEFDWPSYRTRYGNIGRLDLILEAEGDTTNRYKLSKQADVLMLFYLLSAEEIGTILERLGYPFDPATIPETVHYYLDRTSHGSTLSRVVNAWVLARTDRERSWELFINALSSDIDDTQGGTTAEGIHLGAMAGTVDLLERCYGGLDARGDVLHFNPRLPDALPRLRFTLDYHDQRIDVDITHFALSLRTRPSSAPPVRVAVRDSILELAGGMSRTFSLR